MDDRLYDFLMKEDEITWQTIILDLIKSEELNPWDVDIGALTKKYIYTIKKMKETNLFISGKVILAAALLLRIKSTKLLDEDIVEFDQLLFPQSIEDFNEFIEPEKNRVNDIPRLPIKSPQARKRKVTVKDLLNALQKALEFNRHRVRKRLIEAMYNAPEIPEKKIDITKLIDALYEKIIDLLSKQETVLFDHLIPSDKRTDKILTFVPLLHLSNQQQILLKQEDPFGAIKIQKYC